MKTPIYTKELLKDYITNFGFKVGDYTYGRPQLQWPKSGAKLTIGRFCSIANSVKIYLGGNHRTDWITTYPFASLDFKDLWAEAQSIDGHPATKGDVTIGNDVWLGDECIILSGQEVMPWINTPNQTLPFLCK